MNVRRYMEWLTEMAVPLIIFCVSQMVCTVIVGAVTMLMSGIQLSSWIDGNVSGDVTMRVMCMAMMLSSVVTIALVVWWKHVRGHSVRHELIATTDVKSALLMIVAVVLGMFAGDVLSEMLALDDNMEAQFTGMSQSLTGILSMAVLGPVAEEVVFRGAILRGLMHRGVGMWPAILVSALLFGLIHLNPAQIPFAFIAGVMFGVVYVRHGILIPIICHVINNSTAVVLMRLCADRPDMSWSGMLGGTVPSLIVAMVSAVVCVLLMRRCWQRQ